MKILLVILAALVLLAGCVDIRYTAEAGKEDLRVRTLFKSLDGLWAERDKEEGFSIVIDKTYTHDPMRGIAELLGTIDDLYGIGIRYDPEWRSPIMPENE